MPYGRRGGEIVVNTQLAGSQITPSVAGFAAGGFIVVWSTTDTAQDGAGRSIKAQRYDSNGVPIGSEILINTSAAGDQRAPSVTTLASGGYVVTWETSDTTQDGSGTAIKGQLFDSSGAAVGAEFRVNSQLVADQTKTFVTGLEGGGFVVTWQTADPAQDGHSSAIKGQIYSASGAAVGAEFLVNTGAVGGESSPSVTSLAGGGFVATWTLGGGQQADVYAQVFNSSGAKSGGQFIVSTTNALNQDSSSVSHISGGRFVVTWTSASSLNTGDVEIRARIFSASGAPIGSDFAVSTTRTDQYTGGPVFASNPSVVDLANGGFLITWTIGGDAPGSSVRGQYFDANGARVGGEMLISTVTDRIESSSDLAVDGNGNVFSVWNSGNFGGTDYDIRGQVLTPAGAPEILSNGGGSFAAVSVAENQLAVTTIHAVDPEDSALTYSIVGGVDSAKFTINAATGALSFIQARNFEVKQDFGNNNVYDVIVSVSDGVNTDIQAIAVTITNVNEGVTLTGGQSSNLYIENGTAPVLDFDATDADGDPITYSLSGADAARFTIDSAGVLRFAASPDYEARADVGANNIYDVVVTASDGSLSSSYALTVEVLNRNEAPYIVSGGGGDSYALSVAENTGFVMTIVTADPDATPSSVTYSIVGGADASKFFIAQNGQLFFSSGRNYELPSDVGGNNVYDVIVSVSDGFNPADTQAIAVTVTNVNEAVTITSNGAGASANISVAENGLAVTTVTATDLDGTVPTYSIAGGADAALFTIDSATGVLRFIAAPNFEAPADAGANNVYNVIVAASDGSLSDTQALAITVTGVNEQPDLAPARALSVAENVSAVGSIVATDPEGAALTYSITGGADSALFAIDSATGALSFVSAPDFEAAGDSGGDNVYDVVVSASDGLFTRSQAVTVTVANANEAVTIVSNGGGASASLSVVENGLAVTIVAAADPDGTAPTFSIVGGADSALFAIDSATGALSFLAAPNFEAPGDADGDNVYDVVVAASDGSLTDTQAISVSVGNANEGVAIISNGGGSSASLTVGENGTAVTIVAAADVDGTAPTYSIAGGADSALFVIDSATGALSFAAAPDREAPGDADGDNVYDVVVAASDGSFTDTQALAVTVGNVDEAVAITSGGAYALAEGVLSVGSVVAVDADGGPVTYSIAGGADSSLFAIDSATGALSFVSAPDFEAPGDSGGDNVYDVIVSATDGSFTDSRAVSVSVTNVNEPIHFTSASNVSSPENGTASHQVVAVDPDDTSASIIYSIAGGADSSRFWIDSSTGLLTYVGIPDRELPSDADGDNVYELVVRASSGSDSSTQAIAFTVSDVNEAPRIVSNGGGTSASISLNEGETAVTTVVAVDGEGSPVTYSIIGGWAAEYFTIDAITGALSLVAAPDYEADGGANNFLSVTVGASDGQLVGWQSVQVLINNVNESVSITSGSAFSIVENGSAVTIVTATDQDGTAPTYSIVGGADSALFAIDSATGALSFLSAPNHEAPGDVGGDNVYELIVAASDGEYSDTRALTVTVTNANEGVAFIGAQPSYFVIENGTQVATLAANDVDGDAVTYAIAGGADAALFAIDPASGALSFRSAPNHEAPGDSGANNVYDVIVAASDGQYGATHALQVHVGNANEGLSITSPGSASVAENGTAVMSVAAVDVDGDTLSYAIAGGADASLFAIDSATGALRFLSAPNFEAPADWGANNVYDVVVSASDGVFTDVKSVSVRVTNVNDLAPVIAIYPDSVAWNIPENLTYLLTFSAADPEGAAITYSLSGPDASLFSINAATGAWSWVSPRDFETWAANGFQPYHVTLVVSDGLLTDTLAITIGLTNVNEGVTITSGGGGSSASVTIGENVLAVTTVTAVDEDRTAPTFSIAGGADSALFAIDPATGALRFLSSPNYEAPGDSNGDNVYEVVVAAGDGSFSDTQAISVTVTNVNEAVTITSGGGGSNASVSVAENGLAVATVAATDADGGAVTYAIAGGADAARFTIDAATGALRFLSAPNFEAPADSGSNNVYDVIVSASDGLFTDTQALAVSVTNVNEGVTITSGGGGASSAVSVAENGLAVATIAALDADGNPVTYAIAGGADSSRFTINSATGALSFIAAPNFEAPGDSNGDNVYNVIVSASDGSLGDTQSIAVTVTNVNEGVTITSGGGGSAFALSATENGVNVMTVIASDADGGAVTYSITGGADAARFTIDAATGVLRFVSAPNFEAPTDAGGNNIYDVVVTASDGAFSDSQALAVSVANVMEGNTIVGTSANNTISTSSSVSGQPKATELEDMIYGMAGADTILGAGGGDVIDGGMGNDMITGGLGADWLTGGAGADTFIYTNVSESTSTVRDLIQDFSRAEGDRISLTSIDANVNQGGNQNFSFIGSNAFSGVAGQLRFEIVDGHTIVSADVNGDRVADLQIELNVPLILVAGDFLL